MFIKMWIEWKMLRDPRISQVNLPTIQTFLEIPEYWMRRPRLFLSLKDTMKIYKTEIKITTMNNMVGNNNKCK